MSRELIELWRENATSHGFEVQIAPSVTLCGDCARLERVIGNLLSNAVKYSPAGRIVHLNLSAPEKEIVWSVRDGGEGLPEAEIARLFVPFSRLKRTQKMASGSGLGLSAIKKIVAAHGGQIRVQSPPGHGAEFQVRLPRESEL